VPLDRPAAERALDFETSSEARRTELVVVLELVPGLVRLRGEEAVPASDDMTGNEVEPQFGEALRSAAAAEGEFYVHGGGIRNLRVPSLPAIFPVAVVARLSASNEELG